ncbi:uncharacterized protein LOC125644272 isoform X1 [Caretta caretta]|uniref:uncharacterized protein LOC125644272 isoform X1 n=1 Tax=Caretta caretta TaxID=8467 RepID=UPI003F4C3E25
MLALLFVGKGNKGGSSRVPRVPPRIRHWRASGKPLAALICKQVSRVRRPDPRFAVLGAGSPAAALVSHRGNPGRECYGEEKTEELGAAPSIQEKERQQWVLQEASRRREEQRRIADANQEGKWVRGEELPDFDNQELFITLEPIPSQGRLVDHEAREGTFCCKCFNAPPIIMDQWFHV